MALGVTKRSRIFALLAVLMIAVQFPLTQLRVPERFADEVKSETFFTSVAQVAISAYHRNPYFSEDFLKWLWLPGLAGFDAHNYLQCHFDKEHAACKEPVYSEKLDEVFTMTKPLVARSDIIHAALQENFPGSADLMVGGASLTLGASIVSIVYPVKIGILGYILILYAMLKHGLQPSPPALLFTFIFIIATRAMSLFTAVAEARSARAQDTARAQQQSQLSTAEPAASKQGARSRGKAKRDE